MQVLEESILGSLLLWPAEAETVTAILQVEDFTTTERQVAFSYLTTGEGGDYATAVTALKGKVKAEVLADWMANEVSSAFLARYCRDLKEAANKRRLFDNLTAIRGGFNDYPLIELVDQLEKCCSSFAVKPATDPVKIGSILVETIKRIEEKVEKKGELRGISYGFSELDNKTDGLHRGDLIIIAGRPSMGKTAFVANVLENVAAGGHKALFCSIEMPQAQLAERFIAANGHVRYHNIRTGRFDAADWPKMVTSCQRINEFSLWIDDSCSLSLRDVKTKARRLKKNGLDVLAIDYLQLMQMAGKNRVQEVGEISRGLKVLARELDITILALSQLSRGVDSRTDKRPVMSDLRDSGEIEQDADVILFPYRPAAYCDKCRDRVKDDYHDPAVHSRVAELIIEKQRNGERNISIPLDWRGEYQRFESVETHI